MCVFVLALLLTFLGSGTYWLVLTTSKVWCSKVQVKTLRSGLELGLELGGTG